MISYDQNKAIDLNDGYSAWEDAETDLMWEVKNEENIKYMYVWNVHQNGQGIINKSV